jgi:flagellar basal-body rod protein FlgF
MSMGIYQSAASLTALERWQDAVTQNITSSQVSGYKRRTIQVSGQQAGEILMDPSKRIDRGEGTPAMFPHVRYGISFSAGEAQPTRRELDFALSGDGFFTVRMPDGTTGYTRSGQLQIRADRTLITSQGLEILGEGGQPLQLSALGGPLVADQRCNLQQGDTPIGRIGVTHFADPTRLIPINGGIFVAMPGTEGEPMADPTVLQGHLESSNIQPLSEMVDLVNIARAYEANQKIIQTRDQMLQRVLEAIS